MATFVPWTGMLGGAVAMPGPAALLMGSVLIAVLAGTTLALVLGGERKALRPVIALRSGSTSDRAAAA